MCDVVRGVPGDITPVSGNDVSPNSNVYVTLLPPVMVVVKEINDDTVVMDHNHPMAGQDISFSVTIQDIRDPSEDELTMGIAAENQHHHHHHDEGGGCCGGGEGDSGKKDGGCGCH